MISELPYYPHIAPEFVARLNEQKAFEEKEVTESRWQFATGSYDRNSTPLITTRATLPNKALIKSIERDITKWLNDYVHDNLVYEPDVNPLILLDIGGGMGMTWTRMAYDYQNEVEQGLVAFVVSNLGRNPLEIADARGFDLDEDHILTKGKPFVHHLISPFYNLKNQVITLPNDRKIPLNGNTSLVHERLALTSWSRTADIDIVNVAELLTPKGIYVVPKANIEQPGDDNDKKTERLRVSAIEHGHQTLQEQGLRRVGIAEAGKFKGKEMDYVMFCRKEAGLVTVN